MEDFSREQIERYYRKRARPAAQRRLAREYSLVRSLLGELPAGARVLDAPCGVGPHSRRLREEGLRVLAVDLNPHMVAYAREAEPELLVRADVRALPLRDGVAAAALVIRLFHYLDAPEARRAVLAEVARVTRGRIVISFMHPVSFAALSGPRPTRRTQSLARIRADAEACGLRVVRWRPVLPVFKRLWFAALERA